MTANNRFFLIGALSILGMYHMIYHTSFNPLTTITKLFTHKQTNQTSEQPSTTTTTPAGIVTVEGDINGELAKKVLQDIEFYADNTEKIKGVLVVIDSNGGCVGHTDVVYSELKELGKKLPVVAFVPCSCFSGGYWIACAADKIVASKGSEVGSIGVKVVLNKLTGKIKGTLGKFEGDVEEVVFGQRDKHMYSPLQPLTQKNKDKINYDITLLSDMFHEVVAQERNIPLAQRAAWGEGQTFCSPDAKKLGLIDEIGSLSDAKRTLITLIKATQPDTPEKLSFIVPESAPKAA